MKRKCIGLSLVGLLFFLPALNAQICTLEIESDNGINRSITLNSLSSITFSGTDMVLNFKDQTHESISRSAVNKMTFSITNGSAIKNPETSQARISVYPNPATDRIRIEDLPENITKITICSVTGCILQEAVLNKPENSIDVSRLSTGIYLLKAGEQVVKFNKK